MGINFPRISIKTTDYSADISFERQAHNLKKAQFALDTQIMVDMQPYMPMVTGNFMQRTVAESQAIAGSGVVIAAAAPFGRFLYEGKVMVGAASGSAYAMEGEKKVVTEKDLEYNKAAHPKAVAHWFDAAKQEHGREWLELVKRTAGGS